MGGSSSKEPNQNFLRASSLRTSRRQRASSISLGLKQLRQQIEKFDGYRDDPRYNEYQSILTKSSQDIQGLKHKSKPDTQMFCDNVHADIGDLFRVLEQVVAKNERDLDSGAVESHSFIDQTPNMKKRERERSEERVEEPIPERAEVQSERSDGSRQDQPKRANGKYAQPITSLDQLEQNVQKLVKEINSAIQLEDTKQFVVLEKKIRLLYTDLEMIEVEEHTPLHARKENISRNLIKYNNRIKKAKSNSASRSNLPQAMSEDEKRLKVQAELQVIVPIQRDLEDLQVKVLTFDGVKGDEKYKELDRALKSNWTRLQDLESSSEANRKKKLKTVDLIKKTLQELNSKSEENASKIKTANEKIASIQDDVLVLTRSVENFNGTRSDPEYKDLDQKLRSLWAKLNDVHGTYEKVEAYKKETIDLIQQMLRTLLQNAQNNEHITADSVDQQDNTRALEILSKENYDFLMQTKELQNHWNTINRIVVQKLSSADKKDVVQVLENLTKEINKKIRDLQTLSTNSFRGVQDITSKYPGGVQNTPQNTTQTAPQTTPQTVLKEDVASVNAVEPQGFQPQNQLVDELADSLKITPQLVEIKTLPTTEIFGQIQKIQRALKELKVQIGEFSGTKEDPTYYEFESQLHQHQTSLENVPKNQSQIVDKARAKGLALCKDCFQLLREKIEENREKIVDAIQDKMTEEKRQTELLHYTKPNEEEEEEATKLKGIAEHVQKLKKKVDCFNGTFKNIQYVQIENELHSCLEKVDSLDVAFDDNEMIAANKSQLKEKIQRYLEILDERSLKVSSQEDLTSSTIDSKQLPYKQINDLRIRLSNIKLSMENFQGQYKDDNYIRLEQDLLGCKKNLEDISDINHSVTVSKRQYGDYVDQLMIYFQEKVISDNEGKTDEGDPAKLLTHFQQQIAVLRQEINGFQYNITDVQFYNIDENLLQLMLKIDDLNLQDEDLSGKKRDLMQELQEMSATLQNKKNAANRDVGLNHQISVSKVQEIEKEIHELTERIVAFPPAEDYEEEYGSLDEMVSSIFYQIQTIETKGDPEIIQACEDLMKDTVSNQKVLKQKYDGVQAEKFGGKLGTEV